MTSNSDFSAELDQALCDKIISSANYPLTAMENVNPFPGCGKIAPEKISEIYAYSKIEIDELIKLSSDYIDDNKQESDATVYDQVYSFGSSFIQQAKRVLDAIENAPKSGPQAYQGPDKDILEEIINSGVRGISKSIKPLGDIEFYAWNSFLKIVIKDKPSIKLNSPRVDLSNIIINVIATGELWAKYPWLDCYKWCTVWKKVTKCERVASITVSLDIKAKLHCDLETEGARVKAVGKFDELRFNYPILDKLPLEGIANKSLQGKMIYIYDASGLMATIPLLQSKFSVQSIDLPSEVGKLVVAVTLKKL